MFKNLNVQEIGVAGTQNEVIESALSYGFKGIDLDLLEFAGHVELHGLDHARRLIVSAKIRIGSFRLPIIWEDDEDSYQRGVSKTKELAELASQLGCARCRSTVYPASDKWPYHENFELHRKRLGEVAAILEPKGIRLGLEFHAEPSLRNGRAFQFIHAFDALITLAKTTASAVVGVTLDLWQLAVAGQTLKELDAISPEGIVAVVLSDIASDVDLGQVDETARLIPGQTGVIDTVAALRHLAGIGYDGPITPKVHRDNLSAKGRNAAVKLIANKLDELWKEAGLDAAGKVATASSN